MSIAAAVRTTSPRVTYPSMIHRPAIGTPLATSPHDPMERCLERWHAYVAAPDPGGLDALLHDDVVFHSPIVFTPQVGREAARLYLLAATQVFLSPTSGFRYVRQVVQIPHAVLEFETTIEDTWVNGVDLITCDERGLIVDLKVMVRPLKAIEEVHQAMRRLLEAHTDQREPR
jgi:hypothetical protein